MHFDYKVETKKMLLMLFFNGETISYVDTLCAPGSASTLCFSESIRYSFNVSDEVIRFQFKAAIAEEASQASAS